MRTVSITAVAVACLTTIAAQADDRSPQHAAYVGVGAGLAGADHARDGATDSFGHHADGALRLFAGYQFTRHFGVEGGYLRTGNYTQTVSIDDVDTKQSVKSHVWFTAATGRLPIGESFALTGAIGAAFGKVNGEDPVSGPDNLIGHETSVLAGIGAQYRVSENTDLQLDLTGIDKVSPNMSAGVMTLSIRRKF